MKTLTLRLNDEVHKELKILAASTGVTMSDLLMKALLIITRQKGVEETTFAEAFEKAISPGEEKEARHYTKKQLEEFAEADRI
jgi:predicted DNA-binding protein